MLLMLRWRRYNDLVGVFHRTRRIIVRLEGKESGGVVERRVCCLEAGNHNKASRIRLSFKIIKSNKQL